ARVAPRGTPPQAAVLLEEVHPLEMMARLDDLARRTGRTTPVPIEMLGEDARLRVEEEPVEERADRVGAVEPRPAGIGLGPREQRFEEVHVRVLRARLGARRPRFVAAVEEAAVDRVGELLADERPDLARGVPRARIPARGEPRGGREQDERVLVELLPPLERL